MKRDLEFLYEIGALRLIRRQWSRFHLHNVQNLAEHHYRVMWLALMISAREKKGDSEKILKMAMVHDIAESRTGDVDYLARQYVTRNELQGITDMLESTSLREEFMVLWHEYEERSSIEAKIVKDADNLDVDLDLREQWSTGHRLPMDWRQERDGIYRTQLFTKTAEQLHEEIWESNPQDWHTKSPRNRINGGDWREKSKSKPKPKQK